MATTVVDYKNELNARLIDDIVERGYAVAGATGMIRSPNYLKVASKDVIAIAEREPSTPPTRYLFGLIQVKSRRRIIATIWINNSYRKASPQRWVVETRGAEHLATTKQLIEDIRKKFGVKAKLVLLDNRPEFETLLKDYGM